MSVLLGKKEFFKGIGAVKFEGLNSDNPLSYRWYDENKVVAGKTMKEWLRFACLLYTSPSPRDRTRARMPSSA